MKHTRIPLLLGSLAAISGAAAPALAQTAERVSVSSTGEQANDISITNSNTPLSLSANGRFVAFNSRATNLVAGDTNGAPDVFVRDLVLGTTERVSLSSSGAQGNADNYGRGSYGTTLSADGRFVAFYSYSSNLVTGDSGGGSDVFIRDRLTGTTRRVSVSTSNKSPNAACQSPSISSDGRYVVFDSSASNLVLNDRNKASDVFVRDLVALTTTRVSVGATGAEGNSTSHLLFCGTAISADGRTVVFQSAASNLVAGDTNAALDVFVRDLASGTTTRASVTPAGAEATGTSYRCCVSGDGRSVAFLSNAANLAPFGAPSGSSQLYVRDRVAGTTSCASVSSLGEPANLGLLEHAALSADGRYVAFATGASNLVDGDTNGLYDVFVRDLLLGTTRRITGSASSWDGAGFEVALDGAGAACAFAWLATDLVPGDTNGVKDVFVVR